VDRDDLNPAPVAASSVGLSEGLAGTRFGDVRVLASVDSTNRLLLDEAGRGAPEGLVVVADHQTAGRGRRDRSWSAPPGSALLVSVLLRPRLPPEQRHLVTVAAGLAAVDAVAATVGVRPGLKWPNDVLAGKRERKLAGILAEVGPGDAVVLGMGLNLRGAAVDPAVRHLAVAVDELGDRSVVRDDLLAAWLRRLEGGLGLLEVLGGPAELVHRYRDACVTIGRPVRVEIAGAAEPLVGTAVGVADDGRLLVERTDGSLVPITAGDVVHVR
jgi:BirA family transcriptional regulator, biotin operon repressor / biotin---[acetyl-CoA-carboxylase] ligase